MSDELKITSDELMPATFIDRWWVNMGPETTRITFSEGLRSGEMLPRTSIALSTNQLIEFATMVLKMNEKRQEQIKRGTN